MKADNPSFVKAFSRRNRQTTTATKAPPAGDLQSHEDQQANASTIFWSDLEEDQLLRADPATDLPIRRRRATQGNFGETNLTIGTFEDPQLVSMYGAASSIAEPPSYPVEEPLAMEEASPPEASSAPAAKTTTHDGPANKPFEAAWEVDEFEVPPIVANLFFRGEMFRQIAERMMEAVQSGLRRVWVTSVHEGEGRTTTAIGLAMAAAAAGIRVALVDADDTNPSLVDDLCIDVEYGWLDALRGKLGIHEVAVHATEDSLTFIPLFPPKPNSRPAAHEFAELAQRLEARFELVVLDSSPGNAVATRSKAAPGTSALIVRDASRTSDDQLCHFANQLAGSGFQGVGTVENFTSTTSPLNSAS